MLPDDQNVSFRFFVCLGGWGIKIMLGHFQFFYLPKSNRFQESRSYSYQIRGFKNKIGPPFKEIVVIRFTGNVKDIGRNNAIHNMTFVVCQFSFKATFHVIFCQNRNLSFCGIQLTFSPHFTELDSQNIRFLKENPVFCYFNGSRHTDSRLFTFAW